MCRFFLTAKAQESDKLIGLMAGGDDYLAKPFSYAGAFRACESITEGVIMYTEEGAANGMKMKTLI